jgi:signal transduction histidine kinase
LTIQDYGIGFSEEQLKEINAYQQFDREKMEQQGLGLGLLMSKNFVEKLKGDFNISSKKDAGTTITILLPTAIS